MLSRMMFSSFSLFSYWLGLLCDLCFPATVVNGVGHTKLAPIQHWRGGAKLVIIHFTLCWVLFFNVFCWGSTKFSAILLVAIYHDCTILTANFFGKMPFIIIRAHFSQDWDSLTAEVLNIQMFSPICSGCHKRTGRKALSKEVMEC